MNLDRFKFRGKCKYDCDYSVDGSGWVYGNLIIGADGNFGIVDERNSPIQIADTGDWEEDWTQTPIVKGTLGQCTGIKDLTGKLIYEGDIVFTEDNGHTRICEVIWNEEICGWHFAGCINRIEELDIFRVIRNIHENPELLEDKK